MQSFEIQSPLPEKVPGRWSEKSPPLSDEDEQYQSNYKNLEDLYDLMTPSMENWTKNLVKEMRAQQGTNPLIYSGITTKALSVETIMFNNSQATMKVKTQRQESSDDSPTKTYYQDIKIDFVQTNGEWLIDGAFWAK